MFQGFLDEFEECAQSDVVGKYFVLVEFLDYDKG
jgi:hypothetical protein